MTPEQLLYSGLASVVAALVFCVKILFTRADECEKSRTEMQGKLNGLLEAYGEIRGQLYLYKNCSEKECPYRTPAGGTKIERLPKQLTPPPKNFGE